MTGSADGDRAHKGSAYNNSAQKSSAGLPTTAEAVLVPMDQLMTQLIDRASEVIVAQQRLRLLLSSNRAIVGELSLPAVLRRIVESARDLVGARYAALGVIGADGLLEEFIHVGMDSQTVATIGELPKGRGVLGALIDSPQPIRLARIDEDERSSGFPPGHPPMSSFLGVHIRSRNEVYGTLYLTDREGGEFTSEDEDLVLALAATAGIAIENARLYDESGRRQQWLEASAEVSNVLLSPQDDQDPLQLIVESVQRLAEADMVSLVVPSREPGMLRVAVATGDGAGQQRGLHYPRKNSLVALAMDSGRGVRVGTIDAARAELFPLSPGLALGAVMAVPLSGDAGAQGAIVVGRRKGRRGFGTAEVEMAEVFASHAAIARELVEARADQQRLAVLEDRDRIARDLHDHVIQRLFAAGLSVKSMATVVKDDDLAPRLSRIVDDIDDTIGQIRTSIFQLRTEDADLGLRSTVLAVAHQVSPLLGHKPTVRFAGPADTLVRGAIIGDIEAVVREALTNVAKHAHATQTVVYLTAEVAKLSVEVSDNGVGIGEPSHRSGLENLARRASELGGALIIHAGDTGGTRLQWTIPLPE